MDSVSIINYLKTEIHWPIIYMETYGWKFDIKFQSINRKYKFYIELIVGLRFDNILGFTPSRVTYVSLVFEVTIK